MERLPELLNADWSTAIWRYFAPAIDSSSLVGLGSAARSCSCRFVEKRPIFHNVPRVDHLSFELVLYRCATGCVGGSTLLRKDTISVTSSPILEGIGVSSSRG